MGKNIFSVEGLSVLVTGAARGNGLAMAEAFYNAGAKVCFLDQLEDVISVVRPLDSDRAYALPMSLLSEADCRKAVDLVVEKFSTIDVLLNNLGVTLESSIPYSAEILEKTLTINLKLAFFLSAAAVEKMKVNKNGSIINITSLGAELGFPGNPSYQISKAALRQLSRALAYDYGSFNIRVNNICPGYLKTKMTEKSYADPDKRKARSDHMMLPRWGEPQDLVGPALFLASEASSYITGTDIYVDGGWMAKGL